MVYVHIPYCRSRCVYCGFYSELLPCRRGSETFTVPDLFIDALRKEADSDRVEGLELRGKGDADTLYFGGGTPSLLSPEQVSAIISCIGGSFGEVTMEVNPDDITVKGPEYARGLKKAGVNRISMGVQSFDDQVLKRMGRRHNASGAEEAVGILRAAGFDNIGLDLIFGFTGNMDLEKTKSTLQRLHPEHLSCYQLSIEENSALDKLIARGLYEMPSDEKCESQYLELCSIARSLGYEHYEISNWALPGKRSRHNSSYWNHTPYVGLGPGAHSLIHTTEGEWKRRWNDQNLDAYLAASVTDPADFRSVRGQETLSGEEYDDERVMLGLRTAEGIDGKRIPENSWFIADSLILKILTEKH